MTYYYLAADGTTCGPEPLATLTSMMATGAVRLATLVVPAGGEDWTPLARVLRFYYPDQSGATAGPVAFSELHRLNQIAVLTGASWVLEEGGDQWKALADVLAAGGVELAAAPAPPVAAPRVSTGAYRPAAGKTQAAAADPYAPPKATAAHRVVVRRRPAGGLNRLQYFLYSLALNLLLLMLVLAIGAAAFLQKDVAFADKVHQFIDQTRVVIVIVGIIATIAGIMLALQRIKNIGWPWYSLFLALIPIVGVWFSLALLAYPPGYAHHKRFDTAAKVIFGIFAFLMVAGIVLFFMASKWKSNNQAGGGKAAITTVCAV